MKQEDIKLLLKEFSTRFPCGVMFNAFGKDEKLKELSTVIAFANGGTLNDKYAIQHCKPYLRPMSSMTEEEAKEIAILQGLKNILSVNITDEYIDVIIDDGFSSTERITLWYDELISSTECFDWLNSHHFDYRNLIGKGLAIAVTEENNPYKD